MKENIKYQIVNLKVKDKQRTITIYDRKSIQEQRLLYKKYELLFLMYTDDAVHSYRKERSNWTAIQKISSLKKQYKYFLICDIKDFFPSINRARLKQQLYKFIPKDDVQLIMKYVTCCKSGISEGSPLSPALSNVALNRLDKDIQKKFNNNLYIRYGDDILILTNINPSFLQWKIEELIQSYGFEINYNKIQRGYIKDGFCYLGFYINYNEVKIMAEKISSILNKLKEERNKEKKRIIWRGFKAYTQDLNYLPDSFETLLLLCYVKDTKSIATIFLNPKRDLTELERMKIKHYCMKYKKYYLLLNMESYVLRRRIYENNLSIYKRWES